MATKNLRDYRLRVVLYRGPNMYITRCSGKVSYLSGTEMPQALSNLLNDKAAETRFSLEDSRDGYSAKKVLLETLAELWVKNPVACPKVEVIST